MRGACWPGVGLDFGLDFVRRMRGGEFKAAGFFGWWWWWW